MSVKQASVTGNLITMLRLLNNTIFYRASDIIRNVGTSFEILDTRLLVALCDVNTERNMMSDRGTRNGSGEKKSRLTRSIVIKLPVSMLENIRLT